MKTGMAKNIEQTTYDYVKDYSQFLFFVLANDGQILDANKFAEAMTGCRPGQKKFQDLIVDFHDSFHLESLKNDPSKNHLLNMKMDSGLPQSFYFHFEPMGSTVLAFGRLDAEGLETMRKEMLGLNQELNNMTRLLHKKNAQLKQLNLEKNQFLGMAAHDLRKPIGLILTYSEFLMEESADRLNNEQKDFLNTIQASSMFMKKLVDDFLDVSAIEAGKFSLDLQPVNMIKLLEQSLKPSRLQAAKKEVELLIQIGEYIPPVTIDSSKIEQAVMNLVSNAIEHSQPGSSVIIRLSHDPGSIVFSVRDQGPGIPPEEMGKLFKPFGKTTVKKTSGEKSTGLGLVITRKILLAHNGDLSVDSEVGKGTTVTFKLPLKE